jgi:hypothetical protein
MHREILVAWPDIKPLVDMHLCTYPDGAPSHNGGNGWYFMSGALGGAGEQYHAGNSERQFWNPDGSFEAYRKPTPDDCLQSFAEYVRVPLSQAIELRDRLAAGIKRRPDQVGYEKDCSRAEKALLKFMVAQRPRWAQEAEAGMELLKSMPSMSIATEAENRIARKRQSRLEAQVKALTLKGVPLPPKGSEFNLSEVKEIIMPHAFVITNAHMRNSHGGTLNPHAAPCGHPGCNLSPDAHVKQRVLFITVPQNRDLNAIAGLNDYLNQIKATAESLGIQGFAFPIAA